mmetsp:Transcript_9121/g.24755  ORF Transcript_9121/g.24755 Transcript_9121/m.24755 type:complete len:91 (+) Transcript_9121:471-743(+)
MRSSSIFSLSLDIRLTATTATEFRVDVIPDESQSPFALKAYIPNGRTKEEKREERKEGQRRREMERRGKEGENVSILGENRQAPPSGKKR